MAERGLGPQSGSRSNGLQAGGSYVAVGDFDPRVADALLTTMRDDGIAAYVTPTPGARGGYLEVRMPLKPTDRLYVDEGRAQRAVELLVEAEPTPPPAPATAAATGPATGDEARPDLDLDAAWEQVLASLQSTTAAPVVRPWPVAEDIDHGDTRKDPPPAATPGPDDDEHFVPPAPPPLPRLALVTVLSIGAIVGGLLVLGLDVDGGEFSWLAVLAMLGGAAGLIRRVRQAPPTDSGWDDGAVV